MIALVTAEQGKVPCMETDIVYVLFDPEVTLFTPVKKGGVKYTSKVMSYQVEYTPGPCVRECDTRISLSSTPGQ